MRLVAGVLTWRQINLRVPLKIHTKESLIAPFGLFHSQNRDIFQAVTPTTFGRRFNVVVNRGFEYRLHWWPLLTS